LAGREYVETHCTWSKCLESLDELLARTPASKESVAVKRVDLAPR
jgi:hypothetical protein